MAGDEVLRAMKKLRYQLKSKTFRGDLTEMTLESTAGAITQFFLKTSKRLNM